MMSNSENRYSLEALKAYHEKHKLENFIASSKLEGIHIVSSKKGETLEDILKEIKDKHHE